MSARLTLSWPGKETKHRLEPRVLLPKASFGAASENLVVKGDNLLALQALPKHLLGGISCIVIDPPYNTGEAFMYPDGLAHSAWLTLIRDRVERLWPFLKGNGSLWITIDDHECHYLKVMLDELLGRSCYVATVAWQKRTSPDTRLPLGSACDWILVYSKNPQEFRERMNKVPASDSHLATFKNPDNDPRGAWASVDMTAQAGHATKNQFYEVTLPSGKVVKPPAGRCWGVMEATFLSLKTQGRIWFGTKGDSRPRMKRFLTELEGTTAWTWWPHAEVGHNQEAKKEVLAFNSDEPFETPKPERLLHRILSLATREGEWVLDSFAGSGTTGAVAHKMRRKWIMIELLPHCDSHIIPRLESVVNGDDQGGISKLVGWHGGGGFRYCELAPSLLTKDRFGQWVIDSRYDAEMLSEAVCIHMGFQYAPSDETYWQHGQATESDFIFVTTQSFNQEAMAFLSDEVGADRTLLVCCTAWSGNPGSFPNLTFTKLPNAVLTKCEFGENDYSLSLQYLARVADETGVSHDGQHRMITGVVAKSGVENG